MRQAVAEMGQTWGKGRCGLRQARAEMRQAVARTEAEVKLA